MKRIKKFSDLPLKKEVFIYFISTTWDSRCIQKISRTNKKYTTLKTWIYNIDRYQLLGVVFNKPQETFDGFLKNSNCYILSEEEVFGTLV